MGKFDKELVKPWKIAIVKNPSAHVLEDEYFDVKVLEKDGEIVADENSLAEIGQFEFYLGSHTMAVRTPTNDFIDFSAQVEPEKVEVVKLGNTKILDIVAKAKPVETALITEGKVPVGDFSAPYTDELEQQALNFLNNVVEFCLSSNVWSIQSEK